MTAMLLPFFISAVQVSAAAESHDKVEIEFVHVHYHDANDQGSHDTDRSHSHDIGHEHSHDESQENRRDSSHEHTHSIFVSCVHVLLTESKVYSTSLLPEDINTFAAPENLYPPRSGAPGSIFRPPISA